jgi:hypothetical protein
MSLSVVACRIEEGGGGDEEVVLVRLGCFLWMLQRAISVVSRVNGVVLLMPSKRAPHASPGKTNSGREGVGVSLGLQPRVN